MAKLHHALPFAPVSWTLVYSFLLAACALYLLVAWFLRWRRLRQPEFVRIMPEELKAKIDAGEEVAILDLRHALDRLSSPFGIPGAVWLPPEMLHEAAPAELRRRLVVFYCTCPTTSSVLNMARTLRQAGFSRMRPLCGGVEAWKRAGLPVEAITDLSAARSRAATTKG